jgi:hypothetical protein
MARRSSEINHPLKAKSSSSITIMKTKILLSLMLIWAANVPAASYTSDWSGFDSGLASTHSGAVTHTGILGAWATPFMPSVATPSAPVLTIVLVGNHVRVSWPAAAIDFELEAISELGGGAWTTIPGPYQSDGVEWFIVAPVESGSRFYRLRLP